ncbi:MAG TPA: cytochrome c biogenesis protein CcsA [Polyangiaceae bacterium]|nr:cytochrome c biogenesis protein CcsA [Polyangiaceae bacterium]
MQDLATIAFYLGVIAYSVAATLFFLDLARREGFVLGQQWAPRALGIGAALHATHVVTASLLSHVCPVESLHFALSLSALIVAGVYLALRKRLRLHAVGAFVAPIALTFLVGAQFVSLSDGPNASVPRTLLAVHVTANLVGVGLFLLAAGVGAFYLLQERQLKEKRVGWLTAKLPPLDALDRTEHRLLLAGFPLLTLGIVTGAVFAGGLQAGAMMLRALVAYATWLVAAAVLLLRVTAGWRGRRAAYGTIAGAVGVVVVILLYAVQPPPGEGL